MSELYLLAGLLFLAVLLGVASLRLLPRMEVRKPLEETRQRPSGSTGPIARRPDDRGALEDTESPWHTEADVRVTTVSPESVRPGEGFLIEAVLHVEGYEVEPASGQVVDPGAANLSLRRGAGLTLRLVPISQDEFTVDQPEAGLTWEPPYRRVQFLLTARQGLADDIYHARLEIWSEGIQISRIYLEIEVAAQATRPVRRQTSVSRRLPRSAFASYSRQDKEQVLGRVASLETLGVDVFLDCLDIRQGQRWEEAIYREIGNREVFLLFWSQTASDSTWVDLEWRYALRHRGEDSILPNALEPPERCPPPAELNHLQFGSVPDRQTQAWQTAGR